MIRFTALSTLVLWMVLGSGPRCPAQPGADQLNPRVEAEVRAAIIGYAANVQAFPFYRCTFRVTGGDAASSKDALAGKWQNARSMDYLHVVEDTYEKFEPVSWTQPKAPKPVKPSGDKGVKPSVIAVPAEFSPTKYLKGEPGGILYAQVLHTISCSRHDGGGSGFGEPTPLNMGFMGQGNRNGPDRLLARPGDFEPTFLGRHVVDGIPALGIRFSSRQSNQVREFWLDPMRGFLPARIRFTASKNMVFHYYLMEGKEVSQNRWFPGRILRVKSPLNKDAARHEITEIKVVELDADRRPGLETFSIDVPAGAQVLWSDQPGPGYRLKQSEQINVRNLGELFDKLDRAPTEPLMDTALTHRQSTWWPWIGSAVGGVLVLGGGVLLWRRKFRGVAPAQG